VKVRAVTDPGQRSALCGSLISDLPEWFGQEAANRKYVAQIADLQTFGAFSGKICLGLIALRPHFRDTLEIWWMGVRPEYHRQGIGRSLMDQATAYGREMHHRELILMTVSELSDDAGYARTRAFYRCMGFRPLLRFNENDSVSPMMWMIKPLANGSGWAEVP